MKIEKPLSVIDPNIARMLLCVLDDENLDATSVSRGSRRMGLWLDSDGYLFNATIRQVVSGDVKHRFTSQRKAWPGINDLEIFDKELANGLVSILDDGILDATTVCSGSKQMGLWLNPRGFLFRAKICDITSKPDYSPFETGRKAWPGINDLATVDKELAELLVSVLDDENLDASTITPGSGFVASWISKGGYLYSNKVFMVAIRRVACPFDSQVMGWPGANDLASTRPEIAEMLVDVLDEDGLDETTVCEGSNHMGLFLNSSGYLFRARIWAVTSEPDYSPFKTGRKAWSGINDLESIDEENSKNLIAVLDDENLDASTIIPGSNYMVAWMSRYGFIYPARVHVVAKGRSSCPYESGFSVWPGINDLATTDADVAKKLVNVLDDDSLDATTVSKGSSRMGSWISSGGFLFRAMISDVVKKPDYCPFEFGVKVWPGINDLETVFEDVAKEFCIERNRTEPCAVSCYSSEKYYWDCPRCHTPYLMSLYERTRMGRGCTC